MSKARKMKEEIVEAVITRSKRSVFVIPAEALSRKLKVTLITHGGLGTSRVRLQVPSMTEYPGSTVIRAGSL